MNELITAAPHRVRAFSLALNVAQPLAIIRTVGIVFLTSRVALIAISLAALLVPGLIPQPVGPIHQSSLATMWLHWDSGYYIDIARHGYTLHRAGDWPAFFPLLPLAMRVIVPLTGGNLYIAGLLVANASFFGALCAIYALARRDFGERAAQGAIIAVAAFPSAFFTMLIYPEALFLLLAVGSFLQMRRGQWAWAGVLGMLATLARLGGILLVIPFLWEYAAQRGLWLVKPRLPFAAPLDAAPVFTRWRATLLRRIPQIQIRLRRFLVARLRGDLCWCLAIPAGALLYMLWLWHAIGDPLAFVHAEASWQRITVWPWQTFASGWRDLTQDTNPFMVYRGWLELIPVAFMGIVMVRSWFYIPKSYALLATVMYMFFLSSTVNGGWALSSQARYMLEVFPLFIVLGADLAARRWRLVAYVALGMGMQLILMAWFARGFWVI